MKFKANLYARAIAQVAKGVKTSDAEALAKRVMELVEKNGDSGEIQKIVAAAERLMRKENGDRAIILTSARPLMGAVQSILENIAKPGDAIEETVDPSLIAGFKVLIDGEMQFDGSLKSKLEKMFT
jgi:F0F1-type ATP synthase delta subunit